MALVKGLFLDGIALARGLFLDGIALAKGRAISSRFTECTLFQLTGRVDERLIWRVDMRRVDMEKIDMKKTDLK